MWIWDETNDLINTGHVVNINSSGFLSNVGTVLAIKDGLAGFVHFDLGDNTVGGINSTEDGLTIHFISGASFNMDDILLTIACNNFSFLSLQFTNSNTNFIVFANW